MLIRWTDLNCPDGTMNEPFPKFHLQRQLWILFFSLSTKKMNESTVHIQVHFVIVGITSWAWILDCHPSRVVESRCTVPIICNECNPNSQHKCIFNLGNSVLPCEKHKNPKQTSCQGHEIHVMWPIWDLASKKGEKNWNPDLQMGHRKNNNNNGDDNKKISNSSNY